jgi:hypothetical protein
MKIQGPGKTSDINKKKNADGVSSGDGTFKSLMAEGSSGSEQSSAPSTTGSIASVDALLMVQATEDPAQQKTQKRMRERANGILQELNQLKVALLSGNVTIGHAISIADVVASHREKITDPELSTLLDEIDLRAQIELAKLQVAVEKVNENTNK